AGAAGREQKECAIPLTQVRRQRLALDGETESALRFAPVVLIMTGDDTQHRVRFRELRVDLERALREFSRPRHRLMRRRGADRREGEVVISKAYVRQCEFRIERECLLQTFTAAPGSLWSELPRMPDGSALAAPTQ